MKTFIKLILIIASNFSLAAGIAFGIPKMSPGCGNSIQTQLSPNNNSLSILFNGFNITASAFTGTRRSECRFDIPIETQNDISLVADFRGFHDLPDFAISNRVATYVLPAKMATRHQDTVYAPQTAIYTHSHQLNITCRGRQTLTLIIESILMSNSTTSEAFHQIDTIDLAQGSAPDTVLTLCNGAGSILTPWVALAMALSALLI